MIAASVRITNESASDKAGGPDVIVDTLDADGESRTGIEHRLEPSQSVVELVNAGEEIRVRTL